jgi:hypothetical protein
MRTIMQVRLLRAVALVGLVGLAMCIGSAARADEFVAPTPEELAMKEVPGYPGVAAVVLLRREIDMNDLHVVHHYERIKILTEEGKKYANVELRYYNLHDFGDNYYSDDKEIDSIAGRTIHPDGTIIPFTGKPYLKTLESAKHIKYQARVFTLPDVEVGSIIEYRYDTRIDDHSFEAPQWYIQGDLFVKAAHYEWYPTTAELVDHKERAINSIAWFPVLPPGVQVARESRMSPGKNSVQRVQAYTLDVKDIPPIVEEEFQPPTRAFSDRVLFSFTAFRNADDFWKSEGKDWSKPLNSFIDLNSALGDITDKVTAGATTPEEKLHKIYAAVMALENTRFTRDRDQRENKAAGQVVKNAAEVYTAGRGSPSQLTLLFVGMARAAGLSASVMYVPDRSFEIFTPAWLSLDQFDDYIAVVNVDGKDQFFDPGTRYVPYGHLAWQHTFVDGMRQTDNGTAFAKAPGDDYKGNRVTRVANLEMDTQGVASGPVTLTFFGADAVDWRQRALRGDEESLHHALQTYLEDMLNKNVDVKLVSVDGLADYEHPLVVKYTIKGPLGTAAGKRLLMPVDLFMANETALFPHEKREQAIYFHYPRALQDALRIHMAQGFRVEAVPTPLKVMVPEGELYEITTTQDGTSFTTRRNHIQGETVVLQKEYPELRSFYSQFEGKDRETVVLQAVPYATTASVSTAKP